MTLDWTTIITALISCGGLAGLMFYRENKRSKQLQNETTASAQWRELYDKSEVKVETLNQKVDELYRENNDLRDQNNELSTKAAVLAIYKCEVLGCIERFPPFGSQLKTPKQQP